MQDNFLNHLSKTLFDSNILEYNIKTINTENLVDDYYLRILLVNNIDTNFIQIFIPEIYNNNSNFVSYKDGQLVSKPCEVFIRAYKEAPNIKFTANYSQMIAYIELKVSCENNQGQIEKVIDIQTSGRVELLLSFLEDLTLKVRMRKLALQFESIPYSNPSMGPISVDNVSQLLSILSKLIFSVTNSFFDKGVAIIPNTDLIYWTLSSVEVGH